MLELSVWMIGEVSSDIEETSIMDIFFRDTCKAIVTYSLECVIAIETLLLYDPVILLGGYNNGKYLY